MRIRPLPFHVFLLLFVLSNFELLAQDNDLEAGFTDWIQNISSLDAGLLDPDLQFPLKREQVAIAQKVLWREWKERNEDLFQKAIERKVVGKEPTELKWLERRFGDAASKSKPLFISMHGGGGAPPRVNDQQWNNQIRLYEPAEGIVVAPRAPGNTWDLWHQGHVDPLFDELIAAYVATQDVDPDRVYLMGYSAGGDGVYQLAPRMADRFAAASMMAGHPNESQPLGLRNLPFALFVGEKDSAYNRNKVAMDYGARLDALQKEDPHGYLHWMKLHPDKPHWMGGEDREAVAWMLRYRRETSPKKVVWFQDDVTHTSFYWMSHVDGSQPKAGEKIIATVQGNKITIETDVASPLRLWLSDALVDLEKPIEVDRNGKQVFSGKVDRKIANMLNALLMHSDPQRMYPGMVEIKP